MKQGYYGGKTAGRDNWKVVTLKTDGTLHRKGNNIQPKGKQDALLTWYKVTFDLPKTEKNAGFLGEPLSMLQVQDICG